MKNRHFYRAAASALALSVLAACGGGGALRSLPPGITPQRLEPAVRSTLPLADALQPHASKIVLTPASLAFLKTGSTSTQTVTVAETGYTGTFSEKTTCAKIATASPTSGKGPKLAVKITAAGAGACSITFSDASKNSAALPVAVTLTSFKVSAASISPGSKSITIKLLTVNGKPPAKGVVASVTTTLPKCTSGCTIAGPQTPPGSDAFALTIFDATGGKGNTLATLSTTQTITSGKANAPSVTLLKVPKSFAWGTVPSATAGTAFGSAQAITLAVKDADGNPISGTYSTPVAVNDNDASSLTQGSSLSLNGGAAAKSVSITASGFSLKLGYGGLAIPVATLAASASGATAANASFAPALLPIVYNGPTVTSNPEIDLYNPNAGQPGYSAFFSTTQPGWNGGAFGNHFTYALGGASNNCTSYAVTPGSGQSNTYTVSVGASPVAGTCTLTVSGGAGVQKTVLLTYSTTGIGISTRHRSNP